MPPHAPQPAPAPQSLDGCPQGVLAIWHDIAPERAADVLDWYNREHHFERLGVPGFLTARRHIARGPGPQIFACYEVSDPSVLASPAYLERLNAPSAWTLRSMPHYRNMSRTVCRRLARYGRADGGHVFTLRLPGFDGWDWQAATPLLARPGVLALDVWEAEPGFAPVATREAALRGGTDDSAGAVLVIHASHPDAAAAAGQALIADLPAALAETARGGSYELAFAARNSTW